MFTRILSGFLLAAALGFAQQAGVNAGGSRNPAPNNSGSISPFTQDELEFRPVGGSASLTSGGLIQVFEGKTTAGTVIVQPGGNLMFAPMPAYGDRVRNAYIAHFANPGSQPTSSQPVEVTSTRNDSSVGQPQSQHAEIGQPIALPNGSTVTFQTAAKETTIVVHNQKALSYPDVTFRVKSAGILSAVGNAGLGGLTSTSRGAAQAITGKKVEVDTGGGFADLSSMRAGKMIFQSQVDDATAAEKMLPDASKVNRAMQAIRLVMSVQN